MACLLFKYLIFANSTFKCTKKAHKSSMVETNPFNALQSEGFKDFQQHLKPFLEFQ